MTEIRQSARVYRLLKAKIIFDDNRPTMDCLIKDISENGAKISIANLGPIPNEFSLTIPIKQKTVRVEVRWRDHDILGLEFVEAKPAVTTPSPDQVELFKAEIIRLGADVLALTKKLEDLGETGQHLPARAG